MISQETNEKTKDKNNKDSKPSTNILELASELGYSVAGDLGITAFPMLEIAFATKLLPKKFTDLPTLRTRMHTLLYWRRGFLKTTIVREFCKTIPQPLFKVIHLSAATTEILCGSISLPKNPYQQPHIVPPVIAGCDFALVTEHSAFLRQGGTIEAKLSILNDILEGDRISTSLVKLGQVQIDPSQKPELERLGVRYEPAEATISYEPDVLMITASHPFDGKTLSLLLDSGHLDRFNIIQAEITPEIAQKCFEDSYALDLGLQEQLRKQNELLCKVRIKSIEAPPTDLLKSVNERVFALTETPDYRVKGDLIRTIASHMVIRQFNEGNAKEVYAKQDYSLEDVNFVLERLNNFVDPRINPLVSYGYSEAGKTRKRDTVKVHICSFLEVSKRSGGIGEPLGAIHAYVCSQMSCVHYQTVVNAMKELVEESVVEKAPEKFGHYRLVDKKKGI